ncbi:MAG: 30S ribosomal protein S20 [Desulfovibrionaceae bacterium]
MANHKSAIKRHKQSIKRGARNKSTRTRIKNVIKDLSLSVTQKSSKEESSQKLSRVASLLSKAASKSVIHWKKAARKTSRLAKAINKLSA